MAIEILPVSTQIYYTGDMANASGVGEIVKIHSCPNWGSHYDIKLEDGREIKRLPVCMVGTRYNGTCATRFVTLEAYKAFSDQALAVFRASIQSIAA